jgi:hypothetical protein
LSTTWRSGENTLAWVNAPDTAAHETPLLVERARLDRPSSPAVIAEFAHAPDEGEGNQLGDLHSGGSLVAFDTSYVCAGDGSDCPVGYGEFATHGEQVWLLDVGSPGACASIPTGADSANGDITFRRDPSVLCRKVVSSDRASTVLAVGGGRVAVARSDRTVQLVDELGNDVSEITSTLGMIRTVALDGNQVDLLVRATRPWRAVLVQALLHTFQTLLPALLPILLPTNSALQPFGTEALALFQEAPAPAVALMAAAFVTHVERQRATKDVTPEMIESIQPQTVARARIESAEGTTPLGRGDREALPDRRHAAACGATAAASDAHVDPQREHLRRCAHPSGLATARRARTAKRARAAHPFGVRS